MKLQPLFSVLSEPIRYLGLTVDEAGVIVAGLFCGVFLMSGQYSIVGFFTIGLGILGCFALRKYKKLYGKLRFKSVLVAYGVLLPPSRKSFPQQRIGAEGGR